MTKKYYEFSETTPSLINEAIVSYGRDIGLYNTLDDYNGGMTSSIFEDRLLLSKIIRGGISFSLFEKLKQISLFTDEEWAEYLNLSSKSLHRYSKEEDFRFKPIHSEKILELAEVVHAGLEIFGSSDKFNRWSKSESPALQNNRPIDLLMDSYGKEIVMDELNRIDHGIFV